MPLIEIPTYATIPSAVKALNGDGKYSGMTNHTLRSMCHNTYNPLPHIKVGNRRPIIYINMTKLPAYLESLEVRR